MARVVRVNMYITLLLCAALLCMVTVIVFLLSNSTRNVSAKTDTAVSADGIAGRLGNKLEEILPKSVYGGIWIADNGKVQVGIVGDDETIASSKKIADREAASLGLGEVDVQPVKNSWSTLLQANEAIHQLHQKNVDYKNGAWPIQMGIKTDLNKVQVDIPSDEKHLATGHRIVLEEINNKYKDQVFFEKYDSIPVNEACNAIYCDGALRGGVGIIGATSTGLNCTAGFILRGQVSGSLYILTAGHCRPAGQNWSTKSTSGTTKQIGGVMHDLYAWGDNADAMTIKIEQSTYGWSVFGGILKRTGGSNMGLNGVSPPTVYEEAYNIVDYGSSVVGERVCFSPANTGGYPSEPKGGSCGKVHQITVNITTKDGRTTLVNRAGYCSRAGDSGGPVYVAGNRARGIHRAAHEGQGVCSNYKYYTAMLHIFNQYTARGLYYEIY